MSEVSPWISCKHEYFICVSTMKWSTALNCNRNNPSFWTASQFQYWIRSERNGLVVVTEQLYGRESKNEPTYCQYKDWFVVIEFTWVICKRLKDFSFREGISQHSHSYSKRVVSFKNIGQRKLEWLNDSISFNKN